MKENLVNLIVRNKKKVVTSLLCGIMFFPLKLETKDIRYGMDLAYSKCQGIGTDEYFDSVGLNAHEPLGNGFRNQKIKNYVLSLRNPFGTDVQLGNFIRITNNNTNQTMYGLINNNDGTVVNLTQIAELSCGNEPDSSDHYYILAK